MRENQAVLATGHHTGRAFSFIHILLLLAQDLCIEMGKVEHKFTFVLCVCACTCIHASGCIEENAYECL